MSNQEKIEVVNVMPEGAEVIPETETVITVPVEADQTDQSVAVEAVVVDVEELPIPDSEGPTFDLLVDRVAAKLSGTLAEQTERQAEVAAEAAAAKVSSLYNTVVQGGKSHLADAEAAAKRIEDGAQTSVKTALRWMGEQTREVDREVGKIKQEIQGVPQLIGHAVTAATVEATAAITETTQSVQGEIEAASKTVQEQATVAEQKLNEVTALAEQIRSGDQEVVRKAVAVVLRELAQTEDGVDLMKSSKKDDGNKVKHRHEMFSLLEAAVRAEVPVYMSGGAGSGKSTGARQVAEDLGIPYEFIQMGPTTGKGDLIGFENANGNVRKTLLRKICEEGGVFFIDEMDIANPAALTQLNATIANGYTSFADGRVDHHKNTRFVAAGNTNGNGATAAFSARNRLDAATIDRFAHVQWEIDPRLEEAMILGQPLTPARPVDLQKGGVPSPRDWLDIVRKYRTHEATVGRTVTPRASEYGKMLIEVEHEKGTGIGVDHLKNMLLFKGMQPDAVKKWQAQAEPRRGW